MGGPPMDPYGGGPGPPMDPYGGGPPGNPYAPYPVTFDKYGCCVQDYDDYGDGRALYFTKTQKVFDKIVVMMAIMFAALLVGPIVAPTGWHVKSTHIWTIYIGLHQVEIKLDTIGGHVAGGVANVAGKGIDKLRGAKVDPKKGSALFQLMAPQEPKTVQFMRDAFCNADLFTGGLTNSCPVWNYLLYGSWCALLGLAVEIMCLLFGGMMMCMKCTYYARWGAVFCLFAGPCAGAGSLVGYAILTMYLKDWLTDLMLSLGEFTYSFVPLAAALITAFALTLGPVVMVAGSFPTSRYDERLDDPAPRPSDHD